MDERQLTLPGLQPIDRLTGVVRRFAQIRASYPEDGKHTHKWCAWKARGGEEEGRRPNASDEKLGSRWAAHPSVREFVERAREEQEGILRYGGLDVLRDLLRLKDMAFGDMPVRTVRYRSDEDGDVDAIELTVRQTDLTAARGALDILAKHFRLLEKPDEGEDDGGVSITLNLAGDVNQEPGRGTG